MKVVILKSETIVEMKKAYNDGIKEAKGIGSLSIMERCQGALDLLNSLEKKLVDYKMDG